MARSLGEAVLLIKVNTKQSVNGLRNFGRTVQNVGSGVTQMGNRVRNAGLMASAAMGAMVAPAIKFEKSMSGVQAMTGASAEEMKKLEKVARDAGESTVFSASEAAEAQRFLAMAGLSTEEITKSLGATLSLAAAGELDLATAADLATNVMSGFGKTANELTDVIDIMATTATSSNTNIRGVAEAFKVLAPLMSNTASDVDDVSVALGVLANRGLRGEQAGTGLQNIISRIFKPTKEMTIAFKEAGIQMAEIDPKTKTLTQIFERLRKANLSAAQATTIFSKRGLKFGLALTSAQASKDLKKMQKVIDQASGSAERMSKILLDNTAGSIRLLISAIESVSIDIFEALGTTVRDSIDGLREMVLEVGRWVKANKGLVKTIFKIGGVLIGLATAFGIVASILGPIILGVGTLITAIGGLGTILSLGIKPLLAIAGLAVLVVFALSEITKAIIKNKEAIIKWADTANVMEILKGLWQGLLSTITIVSNGIKRVMNEARAEIERFIATPKVQELIAKFNDLVEKIKPKLKAFVTELKATAIQLAEWAEKEIPKLVKVIGNFLIPIWDTLVDLFETVRKALDMLPWGAISESIKQTVIPVFYALMGLLGVFLDVARGVIVNIMSYWRGLSAGFLVTLNILGPVFEQMMESIRELAQVFIDAFGESEAEMFEFKEVFKTVGMFIGGAVGLIVATLAGFVKAVADGVQAIIIGWQLLIEELTTGADNILWGLGVLWDWFVAFLHYISIGWIQDLRKVMLEFNIAVIDALLNAWNSFKQWWADVTEGFAIWFAEIIKGIISFVASLILAIADGLTTLWNNWVAFWGRVIDFVTGLAVKFYNAGSNMIKSMWNGMKKMWGQFTGWLSKSKNKLLDFLDWTKKNSPSMKEIWEGSMKGLQKVAKVGASNIVNEVKSVHLTPPTIGSGSVGQERVLNDNRSLNMNVNSTLGINEMKRVMTNHFQNSSSLAGNV